MKVSESWLREWVNPSETTEQLVHLLTMAGLEVDGVEPAVAYFSGVVVGEISAVEAHPDAERLRVCQVNNCLLYTSPSPRDRTRSRMPSSA